VRLYGNGGDNPDVGTAINCIDFQHGTHTRRELVLNEGTGAPTLTELGAR
jgi:hypothetical protein